MPRILIVCASALMSSSYAEEASLAHLLRLADLACVGTVKRVSRSGADEITIHREKDFIPRQLRSAGVRPKVEMSEAEVTISRWFRGDKARQVTVRFPRRASGSKPDQPTVLDEIRALIPGKSYILLLKRDKEVYTPVAWTKYAIPVCADAIRSGATLHEMLIAQLAVETNMREILDRMDDLEDLLGADPFKAMLRSLRRLDVGSPKLRAATQLKSPEAKMDLAQLVSVIRETFKRPIANPTLAQQSDQRRIRDHLAKAIGRFMVNSAVGSTQILYDILLKEPVRSTLFRATVLACKDHPLPFSHAKIKECLSTRRANRAIEDQFILFRILNRRPTIHLDAFKRSPDLFIEQFLTE